jgi:hypothetical protein
LLTMLLALTSPAFGAPADGDKPQPRRKPPEVKPAEVKPAENAGLRGTLSAQRPMSIAGLPAPGQPGESFGVSDLIAGGLNAGGLTAGGLRSGLPNLGDQAAQCRAACSNSRFTCDDQDAAPDCAPKWAMCIARCDRR